LFPARNWTVRQEIKTENRDAVQFHITAAPRSTSLPTLKVVSCHKSKEIARNFCRASRHAVSIAHADGVKAWPGLDWAWLAPPKGMMLA
jgi:hypothetical protein